MQNNRVIDIEGQLYLVLTQDKLCAIDVSDLALISQFRWYADKSGNTFYVKTSVRKADGTRTKLQLHRLLLDTPKGFHTDHIDNDGLNNCRSNLRIVTRQQNQMNSRSICGSSKFKGVSWNKNASKWIANIRIDNKRKHLGYFTSETEAADAYNLAAQKMFGEYAHLNNIGKTRD